MLEGLHPVHLTLSGLPISLCDHAEARQYGLRQVFWLPRPSSSLPLPLIRESGKLKPNRFPFFFEKGGVTAAGPLPVRTGFPIKP
jgi:hypothetical protein